MADLLQATTSGIDINPPDPTGRLALGRTTKSIDETEMHDSERDELDRADIERSRTVRAIARRQSLPNGEWGIRDVDELRVAIRQFLNPPDQDKALSYVYGADEIQRHIINRARDLQLTGLLPREWGVNMEMSARRQQRLMLEALEKKVDSIFLMTCDELEQQSFSRVSDYYISDVPSGSQLLQASRFFSAKTRRKYASQGVALPDGSFPIPDKDALRRAIRLVGKGGAAAKRHIIKRAKALGANGMLPSKWGIGGGKASATAEVLSGPAMVAEGISLQNLLLMDGTNVPYPLILEDKTTEGNSGFARIRVPFYVGGSINKPPNISRKVRFPTRILQETVVEGNRQIAEGKQPLTVYTRHAKALSGNDLPAGGIVQLLAEGNIGYAVIDVVNKGEGEQVIALIKHEPPLLNAVSLRSGPHRFELKEVELEQETIFEAERLLLDGVDFAPDAPAMATWGIQLLSAEITGIDPVENSSKEESLNLTAETLRSDHPALVEELMAPLTDEIASLRQEVKDRDRVIAEFREEKRKSDLAAYVTELADALPEAQRADGLKLFQEIAIEARTKEAFSARVLPAFTKLLSSGTVVEKKETDEERLSRLFPARGGNGQVKGVTQENKTVGGVDDDEHVETARGLVVPA